MFNVIEVPFDTPAVVSHHLFVPLSLIALFYCFYILMESFSMAIAHIAAIFMEIYQDDYVKKKKRTFIFILVPISCSFSTNYLYFLARQFPKKFFSSTNNGNHIIIYELLVLDKNTWKHIIVCKLSLTSYEALQMITSEYIKIWIQQSSLYFEEKKFLT